MDNKLAVADYRQIELADLVALGQVGIEIILAREHRARRDMGAGGEAEPDRALHRALVQHRQHAGQSEAHRIRLRIRLRAERGRGAAEDLAIGRELRVHFQPDDDFPSHVLFLMKARKIWRQILIKSFFWVLGIILGIFSIKPNASFTNIFSVFILDAFLNKLF